MSDHIPDPDSIDSLDLTVRAYNVLRREGVPTVGALTALSENQLLAFRNMGQNAVDDIKLQLQGRGLKLRDEKFTDNAALEVEHITVYRWGNLQVSVNGDGSGVLSLQVLSPAEMTALAEIMRQIENATTE